MAETILAAIGATVCIALLLHMALPARWRNRVDGSLRRGLESLRQRRRGPPRPARRTELRAANKPRMAETRPESEVLQQAEQEAQDVIERVRRQVRENKPVERDGNVYRPDAFRPRPPKDKLH